MPQQPAQILRFCVGVVALALDSVVVRRIVPFPKGLVRLDRERHHCGVFRDEGVLVSVIDLRVVLGQKERCSDQPPVIIIETGGRHYGLLVDAVDGLVPAGRGRPASLPRPLPAGLFPRTWLIDEDLVLELDAACVIRAQPLPAGWHAPFFPAAAEVPKEEPERSATSTQDRGPPGRPTVSSRPTVHAEEASPPVSPPASRKFGSAAEPPGRDRAGTPASRAPTPAKEASDHPPRERETKPQARPARPVPAPRRSGLSAHTRPAADRPARAAASPAPAEEGAGAGHPVSPASWPDYGEPVQDDYGEPGGRGVLVWLLLILPLVAAGLIIWALKVGSPSALPPSSRPMAMPPPFLLAAIPEAVRAPGRSLDAPWPPPRPGTGTQPEASGSEAPSPEVTVLAEEGNLSLTRKGRSLILHLKAGAAVALPDEATSAAADETEPEPTAGRPTVTHPERSGRIREGREAPPTARGEKKRDHPLVPAEEAGGCRPRRITTQRMAHVVRRGDTLWHIAIRYLGNPWRYPELARLSRIRDPDLIYPGDRVIILIEQVQHCLPDIS